MLTWTRHIYIYIYIYYPFKYFLDAKYKYQDETYAYILDNSCTIVGLY